MGKREGEPRDPQSSPEKKIVNTASAATLSESVPIAVHLFNCAHLSSWQCFCAGALFNPLAPRQREEGYLLPIKSHSPQEKSLLSPSLSSTSLWRRGETKLHKN